MKKRIAKFLSTVFAAAVIFLSAAPFCYVLINSFFSQGSLGFQAYYDVFWGQSQYLLRFWKSLAMALAVGFGQLAVSILAGYGFAKFSFPGKNLIFFLLLILMVLPVQVTLVPNYVMLNKLGLLDSYASLILPLLFAPLGTFILRQSFLSVPNSVLEAAMLDGCGSFKAMVKIAVPMNLSGMICAFLLSFLDAWNMVEQPIAYLKDMRRYPLSVALAYVPPADNTVQLVCCVLVVLPCLFFFVFFNKELVEGITLAEVK